MKIRYFILIILLMFGLHSGVAFAGKGKSGYSKGGGMDGDARGIDGVSSKSPREDPEGVFGYDPFNISPNEGKVEGSGSTTVDDDYSFQPSDADVETDSVEMRYTVGESKTTIKVPTINLENSTSESGALGSGEGSFSHIDGLEVETETIEYRNGSQSTHRRKQPGLSKYGNIQLKTPGGSSSSRPPEQS